MSTTNKNILYILGAGASAGALPVVDQMVDRMKIYNIDKLFEYKSGNDLFKVLDELKLNNDLIIEIDKRRSFDTFGKEIFLKNNDNDRDKLKKLLKEYLKWEQNTADEDLRKKIFSWEYISSEEYNAKIQNIKNSLNSYKKYKSKDQYSSILKELIELLEEIAKKILSTEDFESIKYRNYDYKTILSGIYYLFYINDNGDYVFDKSNLDQRYINFLVDIMGDPKSLNKIKIYSWNYDTQLDLAIESLGIKKVDTKQKDGQLKILEKMEIKINGSIKDNKNKNKNIKDKEIKFAWEHGNTDEGIKKLFGEKFKDKIDDNWLKNVTDIVIIGYSFPFSNRRTDLELFKILLTLRIEKLKGGVENTLKYEPKIITNPAGEYPVTVGDGEIYYESIDKLARSWLEIEKWNLYLQIPKPKDEKDDNYESIKESLESILQEIGFKKEWYTITRKIDKNSFFIPPHY